MDNISMIIIVFLAVVFSKFILDILKCNFLVTRFSNCIDEVSNLYKSIYYFCSESNAKLMGAIPEKTLEEIMSENKDMFKIKCCKNILVLDEELDKLKILKELERILNNLTSLSKEIDDFVIYNANIQKEKEKLQQMLNRVVLLQWQLESENKKT